MRKATGDKRGRPVCPAASTTCPELDVDVLKIPHHGSADIDPGFLRATNPTWAVFSAGYELNNSHWLPRVDTLRGVKVAGAKANSTSAEGLQAFVLEVSSAGDVTWTAPDQRGFFWTKADGEWVGVELPRGQ